jgi:hypothetical protein
VPQNPSQGDVTAAVIPQLENRTKSLYHCVPHLDEPLPERGVGVREQALGDVGVGDLEELEVGREHEADALLREQRADDQREALRDADGVLVHQLVELACQSRTTATVRGG